MKKPTLQGDGFVLRPIKLSDAENWIKWSKNKEVVRYTNIDKVTLKSEQGFIKAIIKDKNNLTLSIIVGDYHVGGSGLELKPDNKSAELGIIIGDQKHHGRGLGTEVVKLLLKYGFEKLRLNKIFLTAFTENKRAIKFYRRLGFKQEGILKEEKFKYGKFHDLCRMSILRNEYLKNKK